MPDRDPIPGAFYADDGACFVTLDVTSLVDNNVHDLLDLLASDEFFEDFIATTAAPAVGEHDGHAPDRLEFEELKDRLVDRLATRIRMTAPQAMRVGGRVLFLGAILDGETADAALDHAVAAGPEIVARPDCPLGGLHSPGVPCDSRCDEKAVALAKLRSILAAKNGRQA